MATVNSLVNHSDEQEDPKLDTLPKETFWHDIDLYKWQGFWYVPIIINTTKAFQKDFEARADDVILASSMKTGSTWLKTLCLSIMLRPPSDDKNAFSNEDDPLVKKQFHAYVQTLETQVYGKEPSPNLSDMSSPRLFHTHLPYRVLPDSMKNSGCKIVYIARNPKDTLVSLWHFVNTVKPSEHGQYPFEKAFESFCDGVHPYGPFFDHVLEYWNESQKMPGRMLFLRYEDLKKDPNGQVKRLASFLGRPFLNDEGVGKVVKRCSFDRVQNLELNKHGSFAPTVPNSSLFRLGTTGDWKNHFTDEMTERLDQITRMKLENTGLELEI